MSAIAGFFHPDFIFKKDDEYVRNAIANMSDALRKRGPDRQEFYYFTHGCMNHNALTCSSIHPQIPCEVQPSVKKFNGKNYTLIYDGFISNLPELREDLRKEHVLTDGLTQEELLICAFLQYGSSFVKKLNGAFAMAIYDERNNQMFLFRDPLGLRPLFYTIQKQILVFASEPKALLKYPGVEVTVNANGLNELLSMGPAHTPGQTVYRDIFEIKPGHMLVFGKGRLYTERYHQFVLKEHTDSYEDTIVHINELLDRSIATCASTNAPSASLLSGGLDSSVISARLAQISPEPITTYSFDFIGSSKYFQANSFQPSLDAPFVQQMHESLGSEHTTLTCGNSELFEYLTPSVEAHDSPTMADVDSSLMYFCSRIAKDYPIIFTGECADELFCGYPWYHRSEMFQSDTFPWTRDISPRKLLLNDNLINILDMDSYIHSQYITSCNEIGIDGQNTPHESLHRRTFYLTVRYFMQTLVDRTDRAASYYSMDARVPFADLALAEYLFNVPYEMKTKDGEIKHLLRTYATGLIPEKIRTRKKSPFPKTYDPGYESLLISALQKIITDPNSPLLAIADPKKIQAFCYHPKDLGKPWFGQLMAGPQLMAYYIQINEWFKKYNVKLSI